MPDNEHYSNPIAPANYRPHDDGESGTNHPLTNDDFRKLLMTPGPGGSATSQRYHAATSSSSQQKGSTKTKGTGGEASDKRKKKKQFYAKIIREEKAREEERAKKYRDRARERREQAVTDDKVDINIINAASHQTTSAGNYKSVAPDAKGNFDAAARRKQMIEESKFLGGDLEHTHLVKGLDYALLQKVRAEIEHEDIDTDQVILNKDDNVFVKPSSKIAPISSGTTIEWKRPAPNESTASNSLTQLASEEDEEQRLGIKSAMARNIYRLLFRPPPRRVNELFLPHRMAYVIDLENEEQRDDNNEKGPHPLDDIPTTLIRSKADCPNSETSTAMSNNDIVINKLTQILSYLRHSKRDLKRQKKKGIGSFGGLETEINIKPTNDSVNTITNKAKDISMYDDISDYIPDVRRRSTKGERDKNQYDSESKRKSYFQSDSKYKDGKSHDHSDNDHNDGHNKEAVKNFIRNIHNKYTAANNEERTTTSSNPSKQKKSGFDLKFSDDSYAECYPGTMAEEDVNIDSDDEPDFDKMDMGSKKGPVGRWDFDTAEEYSDYMGQKEAMPKAAFQYGVKMNDGRKTRRGVGPKDEKQKIDREWQQISKIIESKRKGDGPSSHSPDLSTSKRTKMT